MRRGVGDSGETLVHLLEVHCKSHKLVTRSTFGAETLAAVGAADTAIPLAMTLHELKHGAQSVSERRRLVEEGGLAYKINLCIDAMSLFTALKALVTRVPTEKTLAAHVFWLKDLLKRHVLTSVTWLDTRDMSADGHTKGCIDRAAILAVMSGELSIQYESQTYACPFVLPSRSP